MTGPGESRAAGSEGLVGVEALVGAEYGPVVYRTGREKVDEIVAAVSDDPSRWRASAPPSVSGSLLFAVAPLFLSDPRVGSFGGSVIHGEQVFSWSRAIPREADLVVSGRVARARVRGGVAYVGFDVAVDDSDGRVLVGTSTFLMGVSPGGETAEEPEPAPEDRGGHDAVTSGVLPSVGGALPEGARSASRSDLVRYAGASRDWNPIHWDHGAARTAGLSGVVVHGLLQSAWLLGAVSALVEGERPVRSARFRFRSPLRPAVTARIEGRVDDGGVEAALVGPSGVVVAASMIVDGRPGAEEL